MILLAIAAAIGDQSKTAVKVQPNRRSFVGSGGHGSMIPYGRTSYFRKPKIVHNPQPPRPTSNSPTNDMTSLTANVTIPVSAVGPLVWTSAPQPDLATLVPNAFNVAYKLSGVVLDSSGAGPSTIIVATADGPAFQVTFPVASFSANGFIQIITVSAQRATQ